MARVKHRVGSAAAINPDDIRMHRLIVVGIIVTLAAAIATSWNGLVYVAEWQLLSPDLRWLTPVMVDVPLVVLTLARGALRKRGIATPGMLVGIVAMTTYSSLANAAHTIAVSGTGSLESVGGILTNALAPWLILAMTEVLWMLVTKPIRSGRKAAQRRRTTTRKPVPRPAPIQPALEGLDA